MKNSNLQGDRLKQVVSQLKTNYKAFALKCELSDTYIYSIRDNVKTIKLPSLYKICIAWPSINPSYLFYGKGEPFCKESVETRFREALAYLKVDSKTVKQVFGTNFLDTVLFEEVDGKQIKLLCDNYDEVNHEYILTGEGKLISSNEDKYLVKIESLQDQVFLLKKVIVLLEDKIAGLEGGK